MTTIEYTTFLPRSKELKSNSIQTITTTPTTINSLLFHIRISKKKTMYKNSSIPLDKAYK
jgi:hypothetical protein